MEWDLAEEIFSVKIFFQSINLIAVQQIKNVYNTEKQMIKLGLLNIRSLSTKVLFVNDMINDHKLDCALFDRNLAKTR